MAHPSSALILPLSDIVLDRDVGSKLRVAGHLLCFHGATSLGLLYHQRRGLLVDLSLCTDGAGDDDQRGGWKRYRDQISGRDSQGRTYPPEEKRVLMCIGWVERCELPLDLRTLFPSLFTPSNPLEKDPPATTTTPDRSAPHAHPALPFPAYHAAPDPHYVLRAILVREMHWDFDLNLWCEAARVRSAWEWKGRDGCQLKRMDPVEPIQQGSSRRSPPRPEGKADVRSERKAIEVIEVSD